MLLAGLMLLLISDMKLQLNQISKIEYTSHCMQIILELTLELTKDKTFLFALDIMLILTTIHKKTE